MRIEKDGLQIRSVEDWYRLAPPKKGAAHWAPGRSAMACAEAWCPPGGPRVPPEIDALLLTHPLTQGTTIQVVEPEVQIRFDRFGGEPRNADVVCLAEGPAGRIAINIEAKADEPFDRLVHEVIADVARRICNDESSNGIARVQQLAKGLLPKRAPGTASLGELRYQLLTAAAGTLAHAIAYKAAVAVFLVHEFVTAKTDDQRHESNRDDLDRFVSRMTSAAVQQLPSNRLVGPISVPDKALFEGAPPILIGKVTTHLRA